MNDGKKKTSLLKLLGLLGGITVTRVWIFDVYDE